MKNKIVMLIEDNPDDVKLTLRAFKQNNLLNEVVVARDGAEALQYLKNCSSRPTVILLDLKLPKVDGLEVLAFIRGDERLKRIPVIVLTSSREEQDIVASYGRGANSYIRKPVDFEQFTEAVRQLGVYWLLLNEPIPEQPRLE